MAVEKSPSAASPSAAAYFAHTVMGLFVATALILTAVFGQDIEGSLYPVVVETAPPNDIYRDKDRACFTLHLLKVREGTEPWYGFWAKAHLSPELPLSLSPSNERHERFADDLVVHPIGAKWPRPFCFEMPGTIAKNQSLNLSGYAEHRAHWLWKSRSPLQAFRICGLTEDAPIAGVKKRPDPFCEKQRKGFDLTP